jgi:hypothetical protein
MTRIAACIRSILLPAMTVALCCLGAPVTRAQQTYPVPSALPASPAQSTDGTPDPAPRDPEQARILHEMSRDRNAERQKEIVADTNQLMELIKQLKQSVDKSNKDELSLSVVNTAAEIEKLAKSVKQKMRDGQ